MPALAGAVYPLLGACVSSCIDAIYHADIWSIVHYFNIVFCLAANYNE